MILQRDKRTKLSDASDNVENYPSIMIQIQDDPSADHNYEISVMDINDNGMGITCIVSLKVGQHITFADTQTDWDLPEKGVVMWTFMAIDGFRAGIKFLH